MKIIGQIINYSEMFLSYDTSNRQKEKLKAQVTC